MVKYTPCTLDLGLLLCKCFLKGIRNFCHQEQILVLVVKMGDPETDHYIGEGILTPGKGELQQHQLSLNSFTCI